MTKIDHSFVGMLVLFEDCARLPKRGRELWLDRQVGDAELRLEIEWMLASAIGRTECMEQEILEHIELSSAEPDPEFDLEIRFDGLPDSQALSFAGDEAWSAELP